MDWRGSRRREGRSYVFLSTRHCQLDRGTVPMSSQFSSNPYVSPTYASYSQPYQRERTPSSVLAAGMAMIAVAALGLAISVFNFAYSFKAPKIDPNAPIFVQDIQKGAAGPVAAIIQSTFAILNLFIIACG